MKSINDFIVHIPKKYNDQWTSDSGMKWYLSEFYNKRELANVAVEVVSTPAKLKTEIKNGDTILIDIVTILDSQQYKFGNTGNHLAIDRKKGIYRVPKDLVLLYKKKNENEWICFQDKVVLEPIYEEVKQKGLIITDIREKKKSDNKAIVKIPNKDLKAQGVNIGNTVLFDNRSNIDFYLDGEKFMWTKTRYVYSKIKDDMIISTLGNRVVVKPITEEPQKKSGIIIPENAKRKQNKGKVISLGKGEDNDPFTVSVGDIVLYEGSGHIEYEGDLIIKESNIVAILV